MDNPRLVHGNVIPMGIPWDGMRWDRHKLLWDGTDKYVPWTTLAIIVLRSTTRCLTTQNAFLFFQALRGLPAVCVWTQRDSGHVRGGPDDSSGLSVGSRRFRKSRVCDFHLSAFRLWRNFRENCRAFADRRLQLYFQVRGTLFPGWVQSFGPFNHRL